VDDNGHFKGVEVIHADNDDVAILGVRGFAGAKPMELWNADKRIKTCPAVIPGRPLPL
jgi:hypothetical protein